MPSKAERLRRAERKLDRAQARTVQLDGEAYEARGDVRFAKLRVAAARRRLKRANVR